MVSHKELCQDLLFFCYVNEFSKKLEGENNVVQFADDTSIICKFERNEILLKKL